MSKTGSQLFDVVEIWARKWTCGEESSLTQEHVILDTSWAVWKNPGADGFTKNSDVSYPGDPVARTHAHAKVIVLGMNPGNDATRGNWSNFHHSWKSRDQLLAEACRNTSLEGALMTDLFFDQFESDSSVLDVSDAAAGVLRVIEIVQASEEPETLIVCLGGKTYAGFRRGLKELQKRGLVEKPENIFAVQVTHYSGSAGGKHKHDPQIYRKFVHQQISDAGYAKFL